MIELDTYKNRCEGSGICEDFRDRWDNARNKKDLIDMALDIKGMDYMIDSINKGWGIRPSFVAIEFHNFVNGKYQCHNKSYSSELYCCSNYSQFNARTRLLGVICSEVDIDITDMGIMSILAFNSKINIRGKGKAIITLYGKDNAIFVDMESRKDIKLKFENKENRD